MNIDSAIDTHDGAILCAVPAGHIGTVTQFLGD
jgi:hypothetical protein